MAIGSGRGPQVWGRGSGAGGVRPQAGDGRAKAGQQVVGGDGVGVGWWGLKGGGAGGGEGDGQGP